jgi:drug/metabolite transporter (DMT)-like permease
VLDADAYGDDPLLGSVLGILTAIAYAGYLLLLRKGRDRDRAAGPILDSTLACMLTALAAGLALGDFQPIPALPSHVWLLLLALSAQVGGGVMLALALPRLPAATTSLILLIQPVLATIFAVIILSEAPSAAQYVGVVLVIGGVLLGTARGRSAKPEASPLAPSEGRAPRSTR